MSEEVKQKVYRSMIAELNARITPLVNERASLADAAKRIEVIDTELAVLRSERAEYEALLPQEAPQAKGKFDE